MNFQMQEAQIKEILDMYDGIILIALYEYQGQNYFLYLIDNSDSKYEYMLCTFKEGDLKHVSIIGVRDYLQTRFELQELYHLYFKVKNQQVNEQEIRLLREDEVEDYFPDEEFILE